MNSYWVRFISSLRLSRELLSGNWSPVILRLVGICRLLFDLLSIRSLRRDEILSPGIGLESKRFNRERAFSII
jgi:hypothetical protein